MSISESEDGVQSPLVTEIPLTVAQVVAGIEDGSLDREAYLDSVFKRMELWGEYGYFIASLGRDDLEEMARAEQRGPLRGVPFVAKDNIDTVDFPTTAGTPVLKEWQPAANAPVIQSLIDSGCQLLGKANMHELAFGITSNNVVNGAVANPYDKRMFAGGSSGGSAAAVVSGIVPFALGTDTGGSVRIPAALCGCVGYRPTVYRYTQRGVIPLSSSRDTVGVLAMTVDDVITVDNVLKDTGVAAGEAVGEPVSLSGLRLGVPRAYFFDNLDPEVDDVITSTLETLKEAGVELVDVEVENVGELNAAVSFPSVLYECIREISAYLLTHDSSISLHDLVDEVAGEAERGILKREIDPETTASPVAYHEALTIHKPALRAAYANALEGVDALIFPTTLLPARAIGQDTTVMLNSKREPTFPTYIHNTDPSANAGVPCISLPAPTLTVDTKLPVGIEIACGIGEDAKLLQIAKAVQSVLGPLPRPVPWKPSKLESLSSDE